ncbi:MAG: DMT family transporter [Phycisphaerales bacterium]
MRKTALRADIMLLIAAAIWGSGFVAQRAGMDHIGPWTFNALRYMIGAAIILPFAWLRWRRANPGQTASARIDRGTLIDGGVLGLILTVAAGLQQIGMVTTTSARAGFLTGLYVLLVPLIGLALRHKPALGHVIGLALAGVGLYFFKPELGAEWVVGDFFVIGSAFGWALQVVLVGIVARRRDPVMLAGLQFLVAAVISAIVATSTETIEFGAMWRAGLAVGFSGVFATGVAYTLQMVAQRDAPHTHAAVLMSFEAVFAAGLGWLFLQETLGTNELIGGGFMLAGMLASQLLGDLKITRRGVPAKDGVVLTSADQDPVS